MTHEVKFFQRPVFILIFFMAFIIIASIVFSLNKSSAEEKYLAANDKVPSIKAFGGSAEEVKEGVLKYGIIAFVVLGILAMALAYILYGISSIFKLKSGASWSMALSSLLLFSLGFELTFLERGYVTIANAIIYFIGNPLFISSLMMLISSILLLIYNIKRS